MTRTAARELAVQLSFSLGINELFADETLEHFFEREYFETLAQENEAFAEYPDKKQMEYIKRLVTLVYDKRIQLDAYIGEHTKGWKVERISKTASAIMRCAICEILYFDDVPAAVAINEAVEMAKGYEDEEVVAFINGILGSFVRSLGSGDDKVN